MPVAATATGRLNSKTDILLIIGRGLKRSPDWMLADTEIRLDSSGCEEPGARGYRACVGRIRTWK
jgi:hypothetical protein